MMEPNFWNPGKPPEHPYEGGMVSDVVFVLLEDGQFRRDFTINGKWTLYCENNKDMPHVRGWRARKC